MNIQVKWKLRSTPKSRTMISSSKYQQPATNLLYYHWLTQHPTRTVCSFLPVTKYSKPQHIEFEDTTSKKNNTPTHLLTVAGEACSRSAVSKIRLILALIWMISPLIRHSYREQSTKPTLVFGTRQTGH